MKTQPTPFHFVAIDIGATSGRVMLGTLQGQQLSIKEIARFPNVITNVLGKYYWNLFALFDSIKEGLSNVSSLGLHIDAIGIDTWGVDFVYVADDGSILCQPRSYRDPQTKGVADVLYARIAQHQLYEATGIQIMDFNSIFQLYAAKLADDALLRAAHKILFVPDALSYMLTGKQVCEYSIASTSQLLNPWTKKGEKRVFDALGIASSLLPPIAMPGTIIGNITNDISVQCAIHTMPVVMVAAHDTASAVVAVPALDPNFAYLSSGTWSLMGIEVCEPIINQQSYNLNFTNEGGAEGTIRFLKNITGMWLLEECRKQWAKQGQEYNYPQIVALAQSAEGFKYLIDPDHPSFANPTNMLDAISLFCTQTNQGTPQCDADYIRCIFDSLALKYKYVFNQLQAMSPHTIETLFVIGGGVQNKLLNQWTANAIGISVVGGSAEATAIGNIMMQAKAVRAVSSLTEIRQIVSNSFPPERFEPTQTEMWQQQFDRFVNYIQ